MTDNKTGVIAFMVIAALLVGGLFTYVAFPKVEVKENTVIKEVPTTNTVQVPSPVDLTAVTEKLDNISVNLNKDDNWKSQALDLATAEWSQKDYKHVFDALVDLNESIVEKEDISSVTVTEFKVTSFDVDEKDAETVQTVKVKYENSEGTNVKVYLDIHTTVKDGEVDDQTFELH